MRAATLEPEERTGTTRRIGAHARDRHPSRDRGLRAWMLVVGAIYIILGIGFLPPLNEARAPVAFPFTQGAEETLLFRAFIDYSFAFGIDLLVIGGFLLWASRQPTRSVGLVWLVVWLEAARIVGDAWALTRGYPETAMWVYGGFIVFHVVVAILGATAVRRAIPSAVAG